MCGILAVYRQDRHPVSASLLESMCEEMRHRGPDDDGYFNKGHAGLGFRRLSIIDLDTGHQPIANEDGTVYVILNGEIYNYRELRSDLEARGHRFSTSSDTEVIVHLYEEYGDDFVDYLRGMFGIALLDTRRDRLVVVRDRLGIKPVYYYHRNGLFACASEIKVLLRHPEIEASLNAEALFEYFSLRYSLQPDTLFENIHKLPPATLLAVSSDKIQRRTYWQLDYDTPTPFGNAGEAVEELKSVYRDAVRLHLESDVPLGLFLSGGLDSSVALAVMSELSGQPVNTFSVSFGLGPPVDETDYAAAAAAHFSSRHRPLVVEPPSAEILDKLVWHLDEPIGDPALLPTFLMARQAAQEVKVVLTGEGSDETNAGYYRYLRYRRLLQIQHFLPRNSSLLRLLASVPALGAKIRPMIPLKTAADELDLFRRLRSGSENPDTLPIGLLGRDLSDQVRRKLSATLNACGSRDAIERLLHFDRSTWMQEDLLMKVDKMTMAHSLEARVPFLDHHYVELSARIPARFKLEGATKSLLRRAFSDSLPPQIVSRGQSGFNVPLAKWIQGDFEARVAETLSDDAVSRRGVLSGEEVTRIREEYLSSGRHATLVWMLVLLELWFRKYFD